LPLTLRFADSNEIITIDRSPFLIGRLASSDYVLDRPDVNRRHVLLAHYLGGWVAHDLASVNGIRVNAKKQPDFELQPGDKLQIGKTTLTVERSDPPTDQESDDLDEDAAADLLDQMHAPQSKMESCRLAFHQQGKRFGAVVVVQRAIIGHADRVEIQLPKEGISSLHALVVRQFEEWFIHDLKTKSGILYEGGAVSSLKLQSGTVFQIGDYIVDAKSKKLPKELINRLKSGKRNAADETPAELERSAPGIPEVDAGAQATVTTAAVDESLSVKAKLALVEARKLVTGGQFHGSARLMRHVVNEAPYSLPFQRHYRRSLALAVGRAPKSFPWWNVPALVIHQTFAVWAIRRRKLSSALRWVHSGFRYDPFNVPLNLLQARAFELEQHGECVVWALLQATKRGDRNIHVLRPLARMLQINGMYDDAINYWKRVQEIDPQDNDAPEQIRMAMVQQTLKHGGYQNATLRDEQEDLDPELSFN
jgi:pSer/pThr/pTyr-binding forkhead associated (FHA) protein